MLTSTDAPLLAVVLDSWDRNNQVLVNLLSAVPDHVLPTRVLDDSMSVVGMFAHIHYCRALFAWENAPDIAPVEPSKDVFRETDRAKLIGLLAESARAVRDVVRDRIETGRQLDRWYDHPLLFLQHMIWHEGYHHGQVKLALKKAGVAPDDEVIGPVTWDVFMDRHSGPQGA